MRTITRRQFSGNALMLGVSSLALALSQSARSASSTTPAAPLRQIANRCSLPQSINATYPWGLAETQHVLSDAVIGQIEIWWPNWRLDIGGGATYSGCSEILPGSAATGTAQITYTDRVSGNPVTVTMNDAAGGTTSLSASDGGFFKAVATIDAASGTRIYPRIRANFPSGVLFSQYKSDLTNGDKFQFGATVPALGTAPAQTFTDTWYGPCLIRAASSKPAGGIIGDSRDDGIYDVPNTAKGDGGQFARLFGENGVAYINVSGRGDTAADFAASSSNTRRKALLVAGGVTFLGIGSGINDLGLNRTAAQIETDVTSIITTQALPAIWKTLDPRTAGGYTAPWSAPGEAHRQTYNATVRGKAAYYDPAIVLEDQNIPGAWGSYYAVTADYLHEASIGNAWATANAPLVGTTAGVHGIAARAIGTKLTMPSNPVQTNYVAQQDVTNAYWTKGNVTAPAADRIMETAATGQHYILNASVIARTAAAKTFRAFVDVEAIAGGDYLFLQIYDGSFSHSARGYFNLTTHVAEYADTTGGAWTGAVGSVAAVPGTTRYRCTLEFTTPATTTGFYFFPQIQPDIGTNSYAGSTANGLYVGPKWLFNKNAAAGGA